MMDNPSVWYLISFLIFVGLLYIPIKNRLMPMMEQERDKIQQDLVESAQVLKKAKKMLALAEHNYQESLLRSEKMLEQAGAEAKQLKSKSMKDMDLMVSRSKEKLADRINKIEEDIIQEVKMEFLHNVEGKVLASLESSIDEKTDQEIIKSGLNKIKDI